MSDMGNKPYPMRKETEAQEWRCGETTNQITKLESRLVRPAVVSDMIGILQRRLSAMVARAVSICFSQDRASSYKGRPITRGHQREM
jgi:hypothetical protein